MPNERRSRKFINSWSQLSMAAEIILHSLLFTVLIALILFSWPFADMFSTYSLEDHQAIAKELFLLNASKWPMFLGLAFFVGLVSILFSHHIVGPSYKFEQALSELYDRNLDVRVKLRKWDYLQEVQEGINHAIARWREDISTISQEQKKALALVRDIQNSPSKDKIEQLDQALRALGNVVDGYRGIGS